MSDHIDRAANSGGLCTYIVIRYGGRTDMQKELGCYNFVLNRHQKTLQLAPATGDQTHASPCHRSDAPEMGTRPSRSFQPVPAILGAGKNDRQSVGIQCALCHSTVDNSFAPGFGHRLDGWANRDLNVGAIVALSPTLKPVADLLERVCRQP